MADGWTCETCAFRLHLPVEAPALRATALGLYSDARFPGRSLLMYRRHVEHIEDLTPTELSDLWSDATLVGRALKPLVGATRINYGVLGNVEPHLHIHIVPRDPAREPLPTRSPWTDPRPLTELSSVAYTRLAAELGNALRRRP